MVSQLEVDFVVTKGRAVQMLIQVCFDVNDFKTKEREILSLIKAGKDLKCKELMVITSDYEREERIQGKNIIFKPLWKWLIA